MQIARGVFFVIGIALVYACYRLTRTLGASVGWALAAANVFSWQHHIIQRIADIRADQLMSLFLMATLITILGSPRRAALAGFLFGMAVATSFKIGVAGPLVLGVMIAVAGRRDWLRVGLRFSLACLVPVLLYFGSRIWIDGWATFLTVWGEVFGAIRTGPSSRFVTFAGSFRFGAAPWMFILIGAIGLAHPMTGDPVTTKRRQLFVTFAILLTVTYVSLNPFIYPYNFVILMPIYAALIAGVPAAVQAATHNTRLLRPILIALPLIAVLSGMPTTIFATLATNEVQENVMRWLWSATEKNDAVFDWQGIHVGRPGILHWWHYNGLQPKYEDGWYSVEQEIRAKQVKTILVNYRLNGLYGRDREFFRRNFVEVDTCILVPGWMFRRDQLAEGIVFGAFLTSAVYRAQGQSLDGVFLDGKPLRPLQRIRGGAHRISAAPGVRVPSDIRRRSVSKRIRPAWAAD
jgi:hypothetical protein